VSRKSILGPIECTRETNSWSCIHGLHSNGYSLARRVIEQELKLDWGARLGNLNSTVADVLLQPTRIYARAAKQLKAAIGTELHAMSHITGGGVPGNLPRVLPKGSKARVHMPAMPEIFRLIADGGRRHRRDASHFQSGVGLVVALAPGAVNAAKEALVSSGEEVFDLGEVVADAPQCEPYVEFV